MCYKLKHRVTVTAITSYSSKNLNTCETPEHNLHTVTSYILEWLSLCFKRQFKNELVSPRARDLRQRPPTVELTHHPSKRAF